MLLNRIQSEEIFEIVRNASNDSASDPDLIPWSLLKLINVDHTFWKSLQKELSQILETGDMPHEWNKGITILLTKIEPFNDQNKLRPIWLLNTQKDYDRNYRQSKSKDRLLITLSKVKAEFSTLSAKVKNGDLLLEREMINEVEAEELVELELKEAEQSEIFIDSEDEYEYETIEECHDPFDPESLMGRRAKGEVVTAAQYLLDQKQILAMGPKTKIVPGKRQGAKNNVVYIEADDNDIAIRGNENCTSLVHDGFVNSFSLSRMNMRISHALLFNNTLFFEVIEKAAHVFDSHVYSEVLDFLF
jgi:hypothetical protein